MAVENGWGQGAINNSNDYGKAKANSTNGFGKIYESTNAGLTNIAGSSGAAALSQINNVHSMAFDGTFDFIDVGSTTITGSCSISLWFKTSSANLDNLLGGVTAINTAGGMFQYLMIQNNKLAVFLGSLGTINLYDEFVNDNVWRNFVFTYDSTTSGGPSKGTIRAYVDGVLTKTIDMSSGNYNWSVQTLTTIGAYDGGSIRFFNGSMDEVALWNVNLTAAEALSIYNATAVVDGVNKTADLSQLTTPPVLWYRMGD